jgi:hypothetical protein
MPSRSDDRACMAAGCCAARCNGGFRRKGALKTRRVPPQASSRRPTTCLPLKLPFAGCHRGRVNTCFELLRRRSVWPVSRCAGNAGPAVSLRMPFTGVQGAPRHCRRPLCRLCKWSRITRLIMMQWPPFTYHTAEVSVLIASLRPGFAERFQTMTRSNRRKEPSPANADQSPLLARPLCWTGGSVDLHGHRNTFFPVTGRHTCPHRHSLRPAPMRAML